MPNQHYQYHHNHSKTKTVQEKRQNFRKEVRRQQLNNMFSKIRYQKLNELKTQESVRQFPYQQQRNVFGFNKGPNQKMSMAQYNVFDNDQQIRRIDPNQVQNNNQEIIPNSQGNGQVEQQNLIDHARDQSQYMSIQQPLPNQSNYNEFQNSQNIPIFVEQYSFPQYSPQNLFIGSFLNPQNQNLHRNIGQNYLPQVQNFCNPSKFQNYPLLQHQGLNLQFVVQQGHFYQNQYYQNYQPARAQQIQGLNIPAVDLPFLRNEKHYEGQQNQIFNKRIDAKPQILLNTKRISSNDMENETQEVCQQIQKDPRRLSHKKFHKHQNSKKNRDLPQYQPKKVCFQPQKMVRNENNISSINKNQGQRQLKHHPREVQKKSPQQQISELSFLLIKYKVLLRYHSYIIFQKSLGQGSFATVYLGFCTLQQQKVAIKKMALSKMRNQSEIKCLQQIKHQNIIELKRHFNYQEHCYMVLELCDQNLRQKLQRLRNEKISDKQRVIKKVQWVKMLIQGMNVLHSKNIIHRDLKFQNVMVKGDVLKICDFGLARQLQSQKLQLQSVRCGTPYTMAPQIFFHPRDSYHKPQYTSKSDTYSLSVIFHQFLYDCHPFDYDTERLKRMKRFNLQKNIKLYNLYFKEYNIAQVEWINRLIDGGLQRVQNRMDWKDFMKVYECGERVKQGFEGKHQQETKKKDVENSLLRKQQRRKPKQKIGELKNKRVLYSDKDKCFQGKLQAQDKVSKQISVIPKNYHNKQSPLENKIPKKIRADQLFDQQPKPLIQLAQKVFAKPSDQLKNNDIPCSCPQKQFKNLQKVVPTIDPQKHSISLERTIKQEEPVSRVKLILYLMVLVAVIIRFFCFLNGLVKTQINQANSYKRPLDSVYVQTN